MQFAETAALIAMLENNEAEAERIVRSFYPRERADLSRVCEELAALCDRLHNAPMVDNAPSPSSEVDRG